MLFAKKMEYAPSTRIFSVSEMIIEAEDGPETAAHVPSEPKQQPDVALLRSDASGQGLTNCPNKKDAILTSMNNAAIREEDCDILFEECVISMDSENSVQDQQEGNIVSDPIKLDKKLKKTPVTGTRSFKKIVVPGNPITNKKHLNVQKKEMKILNPESICQEVINKNTASPSASTLEEQETISSFNGNLVQQANISKRTRKPTQKMAEYICRLCEQNSYNLIKIFGFQGNQFKLADKIHFHLAIQVKTTDKLPLGVCGSCINALNVCNDLYQKSLSTDISLRKIFLGENQTKLQTLEDSHQPKNTTQSSSTATIPSASKYSSQTQTKVLDTHLAQSIPSGPKNKGNKKPSSAAATAKQSGAKIQNIELSSQKDNCADSVETDAASVTSADEEENFWGQDDAEEDRAKDSTNVTCDLCPEVCSGRAELHKHRKTHPPEVRLKCPDCGKVMPNDQSYHTHRKTHTSNVHPCPTCGKILASTSGLRVHQLVHEEPKFCCQICGKTSRTPAKLQTHMASHSDERPFACEICGQSFKLKSTLRQHSYTHNERRLFICDICGHAVNRPSHLRLHMNTHRSGEKKVKLSFRFSCDLCTYRFRTMRALIRHKVLAHRGRELTELPNEASVNLVCGTCGKNCPGPQEYGAHIKMCAKAYQCGFCERVLASQRSLQNHLRGHTGERPFPCKFCEEMFKSEPSRDAHERLHTGERPFKCTKCDKAFRSITNLYQHKATHDPVRKYSCTYCEYKTHRPAALRVHLRVHTGEKPYSCDICGKSYKASWDLKLHSEIHSGSGTRTKRVRQKPRTKVQNLLLTETSESGDSTDPAHFNGSAENLPLPDN